MARDLNSKRRKGTRRAFFFTPPRAYSLGMARQVGHVMHGAASLIFLATFWIACSVPFDLLAPSHLSTAKEPRDIDPEQGRDHPIRPPPLRPSPQSWALGSVPTASKSPSSLNLSSSFAVSSREPSCKTAFRSCLLTGRQLEPGKRKHGKPRQTRPIPR